MEKSQSITNLAKALLTFSVKMGKITKDAKNPFFKSSYASLSTILEHIQIPLAEAGLTFTQFPTENNSLTTLLIHAESGEYIQGVYPLSPIKNDPQSIGSSITYGRRYALGAILGLNIDDDDDGNKATYGNGTPTKPEQQKPIDSRPWLNDNTEIFTKAVSALKDGAATIAQIETKYKLSKEVKTKLQSL